LNLVLIGNGNISKVKNEYCKDKHFARFIRELSQKTRKISFVEPSVFSDSEVRNIHNASLESDNVVLICSNFSNKNKLAKAVSTLSFFCSSLFAIWRADFVYVFFPGRLPLLLMKCVSFFKKKYGIYLRGEAQLRGGEVYRILSNAQFVLCSGSYFATKVRAINSNVDVVSPMLDIDRSSLMPYRVKEKAHMKLLYVGRLEAAKGIWSLLRAVQRLKTDSFEVCLKLVGGGPEYASIEKFVLGNRLQKNIILSGLISDPRVLREIYLESAIFIMPSLSEGFPRVLYEAMTYSLAIVTTFVGSISSMMIEDFNCLKICPEDQNGIVVAIKQLIKEPALVEKLSTNAFNTMEEFFENSSRKTHADQVIELISKEGE